jgi:hypothetical protein
MRLPASLIAWSLGVGPIFAAPLPPADWGIDAVLTRHVQDDANFQSYVTLLQDSSVRWVRERGVKDEPREQSRFQAINAAGLHVVSFAQALNVPTQNSENQLPEDLLAVYQASYRQAKDNAGQISAWELPGEPDVGYCRDLPERLTAFNKAMYLGLHDGAAAAGKPVIVLMGALALPPGPWFKRAESNGLLDYTDAYNFHFYGNAHELDGVIRAHRAAQHEAPRSRLGVELKLTGRPADRSLYTRQASGISFQVSRTRSLPMWITECGLNAMVSGDYFNADRRALQAEFTLSTARQALAAPDVAMFMPFILVHKGDPYAMVVAENVYPFPAWTEYSTFTRENPWPNRKLFEPASERASPVVLQWLPAEGTLSHKVAGAYRVRDGEAIHGEMRVYNFSGRDVVGCLDLHGRGTEGQQQGELNREGLNLNPEAGGRDREGGERTEPMRGASKRQGSPFIRDPSSAESLLRVPAGGMVTVPVVYTPKHASGYFRNVVTARFREETGRQSQIAFGVERVPVSGDFTLTPLALTRIPGETRAMPANKWNMEGTPIDAWRLFNGVSIEDLDPGELETGNLRPEDGGRSESSLKLAPSTVATRSATRFVKHGVRVDPLAPACAVAGLAGVPNGARFLRVSLDKPMNGNAFIRVDLGDVNGQRFTIWENVGMVYGQRSNEVWLALDDFHPWFWSNSVPGAWHVRRDQVCEIGLTFYFSSGESRVVTLEWAK